VVKGDRYVSGAFEADAPKPKKAAVASSSSENNDDKPRAPRKVPEYVKQRGEHNNTIKQRIANDESKRFNFMTRSFPALEPFIDDKVKASLLRNQQVAAAEPENVTILGSQPDAVKTTLRDYQMVGLDWMVKMHQKGMPFVLGDEMGLGKTLQTISLIAHLKENVPNFNGPSLVICPLSVLYSWCAEVQKHAPTLKHFRFHASDPNEREQQKHAMMHDILSYDIVVTTYEMAKNPQIVGLIRNTYFNLCVLDEGHVIKSMTSQVAEAVRKIHCQTRVILTGTPLQNDLVELYAILNYLYPQYFTTPAKFADAFDITHNRIDPEMLLKANKMLKLFMIRRLKGEVEKLMPKKIETKILCPLSSSQIFWYKGYLMNEVDSIVKMMEEEDPSALAGKGAMLRNLVMQLRKVCLHPYLFGKERLIYLVGSLFSNIVIHWSAQLNFTPFHCSPHCRLCGTKHERNNCGRTHCNIW
jgi:SWI/SNF-related matrix-associated actin-dependent regulator of chromatin subfamily A member 5